ncbi:MAG: metallophosphoesterase family protein [Xanthobacteraceae bacterium]
MPRKTQIAPTEKGRPRVPRDIRIYAIGDIHGRVDLLNALFQRIDANVKANPIKHALHVFLGDYIDRGPNSYEVIDALIARKSEHAMIFLKGNHESYAAQFLEDPAVLPEWTSVGGLNTLLSYGVTPPSRDNPRPAEDVARAFREALPEDHLQFLQSLALSFTCGDYFFVHAGVQPGIPLNKQREQDLLWIREDFLLHEEDFGKIIVHGHTPSKEPDIRPNRINIDTGAYATGRLTCLVLQGDQVAIM